MAPCRHQRESSSSLGRRTKLKAVTIPAYDNIAGSRVETVDLDSCFLFDGKMVRSSTWRIKSRNRKWNLVWTWRDNLKLNLELEVQSVQISQTLGGALGGASTRAPLNETVTTGRSKMGQVLTLIPFPLFRFELVRKSGWLLLPRYHGLLMRICLVTCRKGDESIEYNVRGRSKG